MSIIGIIASSAKGVPGIPTSVSATNVPSGRAFNNGRADITFTAGAGPVATLFTVTSSPSGFTGTGAASPISVTGLASNTAYTFTVVATNAAGSSAASNASNSITATTVPQAPTIGTATAGNANASVTFTAGATGGSAITSFTATSSPSSITGTGSSSPITVSGLSNGTAYTFTVTATNANGTSTASAASNSVTPAIPALSAWSSPGSYPNTVGYIFNTAGGGYLWGAGGRQYSPSTIQDTAYRSTNGASWSSVSNLPAARWSGGAAFDGTYFHVLGGYNISNVEQSTSYYNNGSSWATGTALPFTTSQAVAWSIGSAIGISGYWSGAAETTVYYRTGTGAWSTGSAAPTNSGSGFTPDGFSFGHATNRADRSVAYALAPKHASGNNKAQMFSSSSISGSWSSFGPITTTVTDLRNQSAYANGFYFGWGGDTPTNALERSNGTTISSQTAYPTNLTAAGAGGIGNDIFGWAGGATTITAQTTVYKATQN